MSIASIVAIAVVAACALGLVLREAWRWIFMAYEYRWETFAVRGPFGRQLLHIRRGEIRSITPLTPAERMFGFGRFKWLIRSELKPKVVIRSNIARAKPVVVSWEGRLIAGLQPDGCRLRPEEPGPRG